MWCFQGKSQPVILMMIMIMMMMIIMIRDSSELFATSSNGDIRVWHADTCKELLRITVPNMLCHTIDFLPNGKAILSG